MEEHWNAGYPPSGASLDPTATYYQVAEVGAIRPPQAPHLDPEALVYFTALQPGAGVYPTAKRLLQPIPMQLATMLIPGTIWSMDGQLVNDGGNTYAERRTLTLGKRAPALRQLAQLFPLEQHRPLLLRETAPETWYAVIHGDNETILIPCFELLRAFCYHGAGGLSTYFFSRLPLDVLCWPLAAPTAKNGFTAHFRVACKALKAQEARLLAALLFNPHYHRTIQSAHAHLAAAWHACETAHEIPQAHAKVHFQLGRGVETEARGISFAVGKQPYFWVSRLVPSNGRHGCKRVVYHPLGDAPAGTELFSTAPQPAFRDILHDRRPTPKTMPVAPLPDTFKHFGRGRWYNPLVHDISTPVIQSFQWARRLPAQLPPVFADGRGFPPVWARPGHVPAGCTGPLPDNPTFKQLLACLRRLGCGARLLEVNNPGRRFGPGRSTFPYACPPWDLTHLPDGRHRPLSIARLQWGGGTFYLFNFLEEDELVLFYQQHLTPLSANQCNDLLLAGIDVYYEWEAIARRLPYDKSHIIINFAFKKDIGSVSDTIHSSLKHAIAYYNLTAYFNAQFDTLDVAHASSDSEQMAQMNVIYKKIAKIYYRGNHIGEPFSLEADKKFAITHL